MWTRVARWIMVLSLVSAGARAGADGPPESGEDIGPVPESRPPGKAAPPRLNPLVDIFGAWAAQGPGPTQNGQVEGATIANGEVGGAIQAIAIDPSNDDIAYIGGVGGGIWKTTNLTAASPTWTPQTDFEATTNIADIRFDPTDGTNQTLVAGIGRTSNFGGFGGAELGLFRTTDGGANWTLLTDPLLVNERVQSLVVRGATIVAGCFRVNGVVRTTDTGASWTQVSGALGTGLPLGVVSDLAETPGNLARIYAAVTTGGVFRSENTGATWTNISSGDAPLTAAIGAANNLRLAVAPSGRVYAGVVSGGALSYIAFTDDPTAGTPTWTAMDLPLTPEAGPVTQGIHPGNQGVNNFCIAVDPSSSTTVYVGGDRQQILPSFIGAGDFTAQLWRGDTTVAPTGGVPSPQWEHLTHSNAVGAIPGGGTPNGSAPHADARDFAFDSTGRMVHGSDGGLHARVSPIDNTGDWTSVNGDFQTSEMHDVAWDSVSDILVGGTQDNGTPRQSATGSATWVAVATADGGDVAVDDASLSPLFSLQYSSVQRLGSFRQRLYDAANNLIVTLTPTLTLVGAGNAITPGSGGNCQFVTPVVLNELVPTRFIIGGAADVWETTDAGATVSDIAPGTGVNRMAVAYGGTSAAVPNPDLLYIGSGGNVLVRTTAPPGGVLTPTNYSLAPGAGNPVGLVTDPDDWQICFATDTDQVFMTTDTGATWTDITGDLTTNFGALNFRALEYIEDAVSDALVVGTTLGVYISREGTFGTWQKLGVGLPNAPVFDLEYDAADDTLAVGTMGRGAWILQNATAAVDTTPPTVSCSIGRRVLWYASKGLMDTLAQFVASDDYDPVPALLRVVSVTSDEAAGAAPFAPDATFPTPPTPLRLRAERAVGGGANGRIYLVVFAATDASGNTGVDCCTAICPLNTTAGHLTALFVEAAVAEAACEAGGGAPPPGYANSILVPTPLP